MNRIKPSIIAGLICAGIGLYPQVSKADKFTGQDFLQLTPEQQKFWIAGAIDSLSAFVFVQNKSKGQCIYNWYFKDTAKKHGLLLASAEKYNTHEPRAILLALIKRGCGDFSL